MAHTAAVTASGAGDTTVIAAVSGKRILILGAELTSNADVVAYAIDDTGGRSIMANIIPNLNTVNLPHSDVGWGITNVGAGVDIAVIGPTGSPIVTGLMTYKVLG